MKAEIDINIEEADGFGDDKSESEIDGNEEFVDAFVEPNPESTMNTRPVARGMFTFSMEINFFVKTY